ncbi:MAG: hypothetical protein E6J09_12835 [Chloroflexi bacterium]|nr:MAG: hypothetical protein E6J09_12835 [Chloroflexota bacterium]
MKRLVAILELLWAAVNVVIAYLFVTNAFVAKTAIKEGLPAQAALLLGGALIAVFAATLARQSLQILRALAATEG